LGEVLPNSQSAREITELWLYLQEKLSRIVRDPALLPEFRPEYLSINALLSPDAEGPLDAPPLVVEPPVLEPQPAEPTVYEGPDRRAGLERRAILQPRGIERRVFGRRASDPVPMGPHWGLK